MLVTQILFQIGNRIHDIFAWQSGLLTTKQTDPSTRHRNTYTCRPNKCSRHFEKYFHNDLLFELLNLCKSKILNFSLLYLLISTTK